MFSTSGRSLCIGVLKSLVNYNSSSNEHNEHRPGRSIKDSTDYNKNQVWFKENKPFKCKEKLIASNTGLVDDQTILN